MTCSATLLVTDTGRDGTVFKTYVPVSCTGHQAERLGDLDSGSVVALTGKITWRSGKNGGKPGRLEVFALSVETVMAAVVE